jgi:molybdate transport system permease protein
MAFPLMVRAIRVSFAEADVRLEQAACTLGAGRPETFARVSLPLARRGIVGGPCWPSPAASASSGRR